MTPDHASDAADNDPPEDALKQIEAIRRTSELNMYDQGGVQLAAAAADFHALVSWLETASTEQYVAALRAAADTYQGDDAPPVPTVSGLSVHETATVTDVTPETQ
ncbi:DUF5049 domain-containing protein [Halobaculum sp. MBLA0147]|uniref:DUF5049 domain-containing protein n=1 Tax=Halobaculum sp. MBLA0147 TaxID=3079934 RepID=UPI0035240609